MFGMTKGGVRNDKGWCAHLRNLRSDNPTPHKKRANTRFAPTRHNIIQLLMVNCQLSCRVHGTYCAHLRNLRSDNPTPHKKRANTRFAPTRHNIIQLLMVNCQWLCVVRTASIRAHLRNLRSDNPTPHKKRANTRFAPTLTTLITVDYFSLFTFHSSLYKNFGYPFSYAHHIHTGGQRQNMIAGGGVHRANE